MTKRQPLGEFFENSEIFITGGSGVVGKALIEKLLRSCNVKCIYMLLRSRRDQNAAQRLEKLRKAEIFEVLRTEKPNEINKLIAIPGDVSLSGLGIDPKEMHRFSNVSIVFHCAATIRFDEPLRVALQLNVGGTLEAIKFAEKLKYLRIFVHVSTFFSNPYLERVEPKYYSSPMDWRLCLRLLDEVKDDALFEAFTHKLITGFPNTYTFTKNLAESLINDYRHRLPVVVYRPSIVLFAIKEPTPGFAPSLMGAMGLFALVATGLLKTVYLNKKVYLDLTPQDMGIKNMLYFTMCGYEEYSKGTPKDLLVYQTSSYGHINKSFMDIATQMDRLDIWDSAPMLKNLLLPGCHYTDSRVVYNFLIFTKQILPALLVDMLLIMFRRKPAIMGIMRKGYQTLEVMKPFLHNTYESPGTTDVERMIEHNIGTEFDLEDEYKNADNNKNVVECSMNMVKSIRSHLLHEDPETIPRARFHKKIKKVIFYAMRTYLLYKLITWLWNYLANFF